MPIDTTYASLRKRLASVLDEVTNNQEIVIVRGRGTKGVAIIPADDLEGLMETAHLLRSPKNADRLLTAFARASKKWVKPGSRR